MSDRKREVVAEYSTYYVCDVHGWDYTNVDDDVCPVCMGESLEDDRIIKLLEPLGECEPSICGKGCRGQHKCVGWAYRHAIRLIKGENK
jgi:hypothetical protein